jgi:hypothetical protein
MLTVKTAADCLGLTPSGIFYRIRKGHLEARVITTFSGSRLCVIEEEDFVRFRTRLGPRLPNGRYNYYEEKTSVDPKKVQESLEARKLNNDWFYWTHNRHCYFIVFRVPEDRVARGLIRETGDGTFQWEVTGPCWSTYEEKGVADTLLFAKQAVNERVMKIIAEEFKEEYVHPLG